MLDFKRPGPKAALTWVAVWVFAFVVLAFVPTDQALPNFADLPNEIHYSHGTNVDVHDLDVVALTEKG